MDIKYLKYSDNDCSGVLKDLILSDPLKEIAVNYFNTNKNIFVHNEFVISTESKNIHKNELKKYSAQYHRDLVSKNFFKVFVYLNDVDNDNGPHYYLSRSHKRIIKNESLRYYSDDELENNPDLNRKIITGKKGTLFCEDTFGFHKGGIINSNYRLMLILTYFIGKTIKTKGVNFKFSH